MSVRDGTKKMSKSDPSDLSRINLIDDEETITAKELTEAMANREVYLAGIKQRQDEYKASKAAPAAAAPATGGFNF